MIEDLRQPLGFPTRDEVLARLDFDEETGTFYWKVPSRNRVRKGDRAGFLSSTGYIKIALNGRKLSGHQLSWIVSRGEAPPAIIDHINQCRSDNRPQNLRAACRSRNAANSRGHSDSKTGFKGVHIDSNGRFRAQISVSGKKRHLGSFGTAEEAHAAYLVAAAEAFGDFCSGGIPGTGAST